CNVTHVDLRPEKVLLVGSTPRLADFGVSRILKSNVKSAAPGSAAPYMAPEAFNLKRDQQTDLWSVGVMLYQMLSGRVPFVGADQTDLQNAICNEEPEPLPAAPRWLQEVVAKALIKDPERRYQTTAEMRAALPSQQPAIKEEPAPPLYRMAVVDKTLLRREPNLMVAVDEIPLPDKPNIAV